MQIDITEKEKTALSLLLGLRRKFAQEMKHGETYSAKELHRLFSELIQKINRSEMRFLDTLIEVHAPPEHKDKVWGVIDEAVERSKIKRYDWNKVFGNSLTKEILLLKKEGKDVEETYKILRESEEVQKFIKKKGQKFKILDNLKISVHARYGENNTADRIREGGKND